MSSTPTTMKYIKIEEHGGPEVLKLDSKMIMVNLEQILKNSLPPH